MPPSPTQPPDTSPPEPDLTGRQLGDYRILRRLGRGAMAEVYLAEQMSLRRQVAFKVLRRSLAGDANYVRRFHNEAQAAAKLVHANIVQIHEVGRLEGVHFIAQEYVPGQNVKQLLLRQGALNVPLAVNIMRQVAAALHKAGEQGIIHRDIKPENIMLSPSGEVKVADFGLARVVEGEHVDLTQVGITMGTPLYMSPEQVEGKHVDPRSDIYSFGVTCYQMLAGRPPFEGDTPLSVAVQHLKKEPTRLEKVRADLPEGLCRIVHRMLAKDPQQRFAKAAELLRDLRQLSIEGMEEHWPSGLENWSPTDWADVADSRVAATQKLETAMRSQAILIQQRRNWAIVGVAACLAALLGGGLAWLTRPAPLLEAATLADADVEQFDSAQEQFYHALTVNTEEAYLSVERFYPPAASAMNEYYGRAAHQHLAQFFRETGRLQKAQDEYERLAALASTDPQFAVIGLFGQANLLAARGNEAAAKGKLAEAAKLWDNVTFEQRSIVRQVLDENLREVFDETLNVFRNTRPPMEDGGLSDSLL